MVTQESEIVYHQVETWTIMKGKKADINEQILHASYVRDKSEWLSYYKNIRWIKTFTSEQRTKCLGKYLYLNKPWEH